MGFVSILVTSFLSVIGGILLSIAGGFYMGSRFAKNSSGAENPMSTALVNANWLGFFIAIGQLAGLLFIALTPQFTAELQQYGVTTSKGMLIVIILFLGLITGAIEYGLTVGVAAVTANTLKSKNKSDKNKPAVPQTPIYFNNPPQQTQPQPSPQPFVAIAPEPQQYPPPPEFYTPNKQEFDNQQ